MRKAAILLLLAGTVLAGGLIAHAESDAILHAFTTLGLRGFLGLVTVHLGLIALMGVAWSVLGPGATAPFLWARLVRDGASEVLPLSQIGGFVLGARALVLAGLTAGLASASTVVDVTLELVAQLFYTMLGLALLAWLRPGSAIEVPAIAALVAMALLATLFVFAQQHGAGATERLLIGLANRLLGPRPSGGGTLRSTIAALHRRPAKLIVGTLLHLLAWILVGGETWLILTLIGAPIGLGAALVIDSLLSGLRSVAFMVPQALGVQEGGYILLGALFGITPETALALSLIRRARDIAIGAPALLAWQLVEGRRAFRPR